MKNFYKNLTAICLALATTVTAFGKPARPGYVEKITPDGKVIKVRIEGDEHGRLIFDEKGNLLERDEKGNYVPSRQNPDDLRAFFAKRRAEAGHKAQARRGAKPRIGLMNGFNFPSEGEPHTLAILVEFSDRNFYVENPQDFFYRMLNGDTFTDYESTGSLRNYYEDSSDGKFRPVFDVVGPVKVPGTVAYYGDNVLKYSEGGIKFYDDARPYQMVIDACDILKEQGFDFSPYDTTGDGEIDNIFFFYAGFGEADGGPENTIWPHAHYLDLVEEAEARVYDGVKLNHYACSNELIYPKNVNGRILPDGIGSVVHEFTHVMGFPDLYSTMGEDCVTPYHWSVMDIGLYHNNSRTPPALSAFERMAFGWITPEDLSEGMHTLIPLQDEGGKALIARRTTPDASGNVPDEFFIFENKIKKGWDKYLAAEGMLVWHINFNQERWDHNMVNAIPSEQNVRVVEADNYPSQYQVVEEPGKKPEYKFVYHDDGDTFPGKTGAVGFTPTTVPAFVDRGGNTLGFDIVDIARAENGEVTFRVTAANQSGVKDTFAEGADGEAEYYNLQGVRIQQPGKGVYIRISGGKAEKVLIN